MQTHFGVGSALAALTVLLSVFTAGAVASVVATRRRERANEAAADWRTIKLRNGVTAPSPWHSPPSRMNAPAMVEVFPRSQRPCDRTLALPFPPSPAPVREVPVAPLHSQDSATPKETTPATQPATNKQRVQALIVAGKGQNAIIKEVWGASPGGSRRFIEAREQYRQYAQEVSANA